MLSLGVMSCSANLPSFDPSVPEPVDASARVPTSGDLGDDGGAAPTPEGDDAGALLDDGGGNDGGTARDAGGSTSDGGGCVLGTNLARCGTMTATTTYSTTYPASSLNDGLSNTSWYASSGVCQVAGCAPDTVWVDLTFASASTVGRVKLFGNRDGYPSNYDVLTARIELRDAANGLLQTRVVSTSRGAEPNGDAEAMVLPPVANVKVVRVVILTGESTASGFGELEVYAD